MKLFTTRRADCALIGTSCHPHAVNPKGHRCPLGCSACRKPSGHSGRAGLTTRVQTLTVRGIHGQTYSVMNYALGAWAIGSVTLKDVRVNNATNSGEDFGIAAYTIGAYRRLSTVDPYIWDLRTEPWLNDAQMDFVIRQM